MTMVERILSHLLFLVALTYPWSKSTHLFADAYLVGDVVDTAVLTTRKELGVDLLMANQPLFGIPKTVHLPRLPERFSLSFEEGLHSLPYVDGQSLEQLIVTFIYNKSGIGRIESVKSKAVYSKRKFDPKRKIDVIFEWIEEEAVDIVAGSTVLFFTTFVASLLFLLQLCMTGEIEENGDDGNDNDPYYKGR